MNRKLNNNPHWKGGRFWNKQKRCYMVKVGGKYIREHRHIASQLFGDTLRPTDDVRWKNGDRRDNRIENLEVVTHSFNRVVQN